MILIISAFVKLGKACQKLATIPAIIGPENEVPLAVVIFPEVSDTTAFWP